MIGWQRGDIRVFSLGSVPLSQHLLASQIDWIEERKRCREWLFPASLINARAAIHELSVLEDETLLE
jgi:hypothetical protein